jgi:hypothetical protein
VLLVVVVLLLTACSGRGDLRQIPLAEWAERYDAICLEAQRQLEWLPDREPETPQELADLLESSLPIAEEFEARVDALPEPEREQEAVAQLVELNVQLREQIEALAGALRATDDVESDRISSEIDLLIAEAEEIERAIGAHACANAGSESSPETGVGV